MSIERLIVAGYRRQKYDYGWWQTQRERFHLPPGPPPSPFKVRTLANILPDVLGEMNLKEDAWLCEISGVWRELVGDQIADHARPGRVENRILFVYVQHSIWLNELSRYGKKQMLSRLQRRFGVSRIRDVKLQLDPEG